MPVPLCYLSHLNMMNREIKIAPSILAADFANLAEEIKKVEEAGAQLLHIDVMDGHFVPNITIGPLIVSALKDQTKLLLDVHLMIENPQKFIPAFAAAGSDIISVHIEAYQSSKLEPACRQGRAQSSKVKETILKIKSFGIKAGIALNPATPLSAVEPFLGCLDMIVVMSVHPGFGGQKFMPQVLPKVTELRKKISSDNIRKSDFHKIRKSDFDIRGGIEIEVDGGINDQNSKDAIEAGADILVAGTYVFKSKDIPEAIRRLKECGG